jgi:uncharacterized protein YwgA
MYIAELVLHSIKILKENDFMSGRTNIQKLIFFSIKDKREMYAYYEPYHYGPYSEDVQVAVQALEARKMISYKNNQGYFFDEQKFDDYLNMTRHNTDSKYVNNIEREVSFLRNKKIISVKEIAAFAKVYYYYMVLDSEKNLKQYIEKSAPHTWPSLMNYKKDFPKYIRFAAELNNKLA